MATNKDRNERFQQISGQELLRIEYKDDDIAFQFMQNVIDLLKKYLSDCQDREKKIINFMPPEQLATALDVKLRDDPENLSEIIKRCETIIHYSLKTAHPRFCNQLYGGLDMVALCGRWISAATTTNAFNFEVGPVSTMMEAEVHEHIMTLFGFEDGEGIFTAGGSMSNQYAVSLALFNCHEQCITEGFRALSRPMVILTSKHSHYSFLKGAILMNLGSMNVIEVECDDRPFNAEYSYCLDARGCMLPTDLQRKIEELKQNDKEPFLVNVTCGTTVLGAFDPIDKIADICDKHNLWLHVDAAFGFPAVFSSRKQSLLFGVSRASSLTWDAHKVLGCPFSCSGFITKKKGLLKKIFGTTAKYAFAKDRVLYDSDRYDSGMKSFQCGRPADVVSLWLMWKAQGDKGFADKLQYMHVLVTHLQKEIKKREGFELVTEPMFITVCFWYIPKCIRYSSMSDLERDELLSKAIRKIKVDMTIAGKTLVACQPAPGIRCFGREENRENAKMEVNFFRIVLLNRQLTTKDIDSILNEIEKEGDKYSLDELRAAGESFPSN